MYVFWQEQIFCLVPPGLIRNQKQSAVRESKRHLFKIKAHHFGVYPGKEEREAFAAKRGDAGIYIEVFVSRRHRTRQALSLQPPHPSEPWFQAESALVEKENKAFRRDDERNYFLLEFFLNSLRDFSSAFACAGRGTFCRNPWFRISFHNGMRLMHIPNSFSISARSFSSVQ